MTKAPVRYLSVCSGLEGASLAFEPLGWTPVGFAEIEAFPAAILAARYGSNLPGEPLSGNAPPNFGDFTAIDLDRLGDVDLLIGGTPCQAFSVAGKRLSLADARGNLTLAYAVLAHELARSHGLRNAIWENVPGVLSTPDNAFGCFLGELVGADDALEPVARPAREKSNAFWRWRPAGVERDEDGGEVAVEAAHVTRWPRAGMVAGPLGRAAWRLLDAQYFGVPQRRERVFVIVDFGDGADPAAVLFERQGVRRHPPARGGAGEGVAADAAASVGGCDENDAADGRLIAAFGGNRTAGPLDVATAVRAKGGTGHGDFESETFIAHALRGEGFDASEDGTGRGTPIVPIAFDLRGREGGAQFEGPHDTANIRAASGGSSRSYVATQWAVRRLTPTECERLQGVPDGHTRIAWRGKPAGACPDGPRYRALGNSWAVPVVRWIGARLDAALFPKSPRSVPALTGGHSENQRGASE